MPVQASALRHLARKWHSVTHETNYHCNLAHAHVISVATECLILHSPKCCSQTSNVMVVVWLSSANSSHLYFAAVPSTALGPLREIAFLQWQPTWLPMTACCDLQTNSFSTITTRQLQKAMGRHSLMAMPEGL